MWLGGTLLVYKGISADPLTEFEVEQFFTFSTNELKAIQHRRGELNQLGIALQLGFLRMTGRHLNSVNILPIKILQYIGKQLNIQVPTVASLRTLYRQRRSRYYHQNVAADVLGFKLLTNYRQRALVTFLRREAGTRTTFYQLTVSAKRWLYQ